LYWKNTSEIACTGKTHLKFHNVSEYPIIGPPHDKATFSLNAKFSPHGNFESAVVMLKRISLQPKAYPYLATLTKGISVYASKIYVYLYLNRNIPPQANHSWLNYFGE
jgi:hypothetical protein